MVGLAGHGRAKYTTGTPLGSSRGRGWSGLLAERWSHSKGDLGEVRPRETEIIVMLEGGAQRPVDAHGAAGRATHVPEGHGSLDCGRGRLRLAGTVVLGNAPQSTAHAAALLRASRFKETGLDLREQSRWDETVAEDVRLTGQRRQLRISEIPAGYFTKSRPRISISSGRP